ncbi:MAG: hypothetical protein GXO40_02235 [Epsilonproteobacteria bacterium]|nr:hypothetical protein [Campylobacterota bacterium]
MKKILLLLLTAHVLFAISGAELATMLHLSPGSKAMIQWQHVFTSKRKMRRLGIDKLSSKEKQILKKYLIEHAADSPEPIAAGM